MAEPDPIEQATEQTADLGNGITVAYDTFGRRDDPAVLLIMGLAGPLNWWHPDLCREIAARGFFVIRYDNRDVGRSTILRDYGGSRSSVVRGYLRPKTRPPYSITDMADDAIRLLDVLQIERANVVGVSMGGMIAQTITLEHPERVLSLVSIMATTGRRSVGWQDPRLFPLLLRPARRTRQEAIDQSVHTWKMIGSPAYPTPADETRERAAETFDRGMSASGVVRQTQAILAQPDRTARLQEIAVPTLVIHGLNDRLIHVSGGRATSRAIPGSELMLIPGMGHDLPRPLWSAFADGIERTAQRAASSSNSSSASRK